MKPTELPLLIGVTGHRDLAEPEKVRQQLKCFFRKLASAMPNTRFCLCSGLAIGADQLFVKCGKEILGDRAETFAVLPFPRDMYRKDFERVPEDLQAYDELLETSNYVTELSTNRDNEVEAYKKVGEFLVEHVNILISIWDGNIACNNDKDKKPKPGGTWDVSYRWMNYENHHPDRLFSTYRNPTLIWIEAKRNESADRWDADAPVKALLGKPSAKSAAEQNNQKNKIAIFKTSVPTEKFLSHYFAYRQVDQALKEIDDYNALLKLEPIPPGRAVSEKYLGLAGTTGVKKEVARFAILDDSANTAQKQYEKQFLWIFILSFLLGVFAQIYGGVEHTFLSFPAGAAKPYQPITWALPMYLLLIILVFAYSLFQKRKKIDDKYLDRRILAEVLRIDIFWKIAGVAENVKDLFMQKAPEHVEWTVIALNNWAFMDQFSADEAEDKNGTDVKIAWVEDQLKYYDKAANRLQKRAKKIYSIALFVAGISMLCVIYFFIDTFIREITPAKLRNPLDAINGLLVGFGSFFLASFNFFLAKKGWNETAASYSSKKKLFEIVRDCLTVLEQKKAESDEKRSVEKEIELALQIDRYANVNDYLIYLGETALQEHEEWLEQQRKSKPEPNL